MTRRSALGGSTLLLVAVLVFAANLRGPLAALGPVVGEVATELALSPAAVGLLTGLPVLCFALAAPLASGLVARAGVGWAVTGALVVIVAGTVLRSAAGFTAALAGTLLIGVAITIGNIAVPVVVRRDFPLAIAGVTGAYTAAMNLGAMATTALTAPLASALGWRRGLAAWGLLALAALALWLVAAVVRRKARALPAPSLPSAPGSPSAVSTASASGTGSAPRAGSAPGSGSAPGAAPAPASPVAPDGPAPPVLRRPFVWLLAGVFGMQSFGYYGMTAWLPELLADVLLLDPAGAGGAAAPFQAAAVVSALAVPVALARRVPARVVFLVLVGLWLALPLGVLWAPAGWLVWVTSAGLAQGGLFTVVMAVVLQRAVSVADARRTSAAVQTIGYLIAASGPSVLGALRGTSGSWLAPNLLLVTGFCLAAVAGAIAMRTPVRT